MNPRALLLAALASAMPTPSIHRVAADTKAGRRFVSRKYRSRNCYAHVTNGARECERRRRQMGTGEFAA